MTVRDVADRAVQVLTSAGFTSEDARRDVSVLARHVLGWTMAEWVTNAGAQVPAGFADALTALVERRRRREPVAYITGIREFYGREFMVTPAVLIPRPETEGVVETLATGELGNWGTGARLIVDVGTGSGCLAITLALELPEASVLATDTSADALAVARENARRLGAGRIEFVQASLIPGNLPPLDLIVSNPPYVPERDLASLPADVRDFEPASALFAGADGLDVIRTLVPRGAFALKPGGLFVMEIGAGQADAVTALVAHTGLQLLTIQPDLQGIPRIVVARRAASV